MKRGIAFEGGGAKGAYQAGAMKAFNQRKIYFKGVVGTSIGSINAACYAQKIFAKANRIWLSTDSKYLFGIEGRIINNITTGNFKLDDLKKGFSSLVKIVKNAGIDTKNIKKILETNLDEEKIRKNNIDFGIVTYNISDKKPVEIFIEDIPKGKLVEYILASCYLPIFKFEKIIDDKFYFDGGIHLNCPIDMLIDKDYDEIYAIRAWHGGRLKYKHKKGVKVHVITPRENLGSIIDFTPESAQYRMDLGYYDTIKYLDKLDGNKYYFKPYSENYYSHLFDKPTLKKMIDKHSNSLLIKSDKDFILKIIEKVCEECKIKRFRVYNMPYLITRLKYIMIKHKNSEYYEFIKKIKVDFE